MTNLEFIRTADETELALRLMCPYDLDDVPLEQFPCSIDKEKQTKANCHKCLLEWLHSERKASE